MRWCIAATAVLLASAGPVLAGPAGLSPHRAVYDLSLKDASERSGIEGMVGRMVYEFNGSACDGYSVSFRFVTEIDAGGSKRMTDQQTTTFENIEQRTFEFVTRSYINQALDRETKGSASLDDGELKVELASPEMETLELTPALFPTEHMIELIEKAKNGERFYQSRIFDGSDEADETLITTTVVGDREAAQLGDPELGEADGLADDRYWPVAIAYFAEKPEEEGDALPIYSIDFKLYENGVTRGLTMDYGDFVLEGKLSGLEIFNAEPCNR